MRNMDDVFALLVADDPRRSADRVLGRLVAIHKAKGGAVLRATEDRPNVFLSQSLSLESLGKLPARWRTHGSALGSAQAVVEEGFSLTPVFHGGRLIAAVYLEEPENVDGKDFAFFAPALAQAIRAAETAPSLDRMAAAGALSGADAHRQQFLAVLEKNQWNIARVARELGVTRRTIYMRLQSFGIPRKRVPKILKEAPATSG